MLTKYILILLGCYVYSVVSVSSFIGKGQRAELFELIDNEIPTVRVNMPINEFFEFKRNANLLSNDIDKYVMPRMKESVMKYLSEIQKINFFESFPEYDFKNLFPQLQINEDGYANFDVEKVASGFDYDPAHYIEDTGIFDVFLNHFFKTNKNFNLVEIIDTISKLYDSDIHEYIIEKLFINKDDYFKFSIDEIYDDSNNNDPSIIRFLDLIRKLDSNIELKSFKTKNATMTFELNGIKKSFEKVTFSLGGQLSREFSKPHYNLKIRGGKELYGRSQFKLRSDVIEPTYLRTKLASDIYNRLGIKSLSAGYIQLYINDEFMGLYIITDTYHLSWVERVYGDKNSVSLYDCSRGIEYTCTNKNDEIPDEIKDETEAELNNFLDKIKNFKSASEIEDIFEVEHFLHEIALEYLLLGWDHIVRGHNFFFYKQPNGKWIYLTQDFDHDFGHQYPEGYNYSFEEFIYNKYQFEDEIHLVDVLILQNPQKFNEILKDYVEKVFNPSTLYAHIDELKQFIKPYVQLDKTPDSNGYYPGTINKIDESFYSMEQWDAHSEFTTGMEPAENSAYYIDKKHRISYGLKYYILMKYRNVCKTYEMKCDPIYIDKNYSYPINKNVEEFQNRNNDNNNGYDDTMENPTEITTEIPTENFMKYLFSENESSSEEEIEYEIDGPTIGIDDESSLDEDDTTESVESSISTAAVNKTTKITVTKTVYYTKI